MRKRQRWKRNKEVVESIVVYLLYSYLIVIVRGSLLIDERGKSARAR